MDKGTVQSLDDRTHHHRDILGRSENSWHHKYHWHITVNSQVDSSQADSDTGLSLDHSCLGYHRYTLSYSLHPTNLVDRHWHTTHHAILVDIDTPH